MYRGKVEREAVRKASSRIKEIEAQEKERRGRLQRIKAQERELLILSRMPAVEYMNYDRVKQTSSAKVLQRCWRKVSRAKKKIKSDEEFRESVDSGNNSAASIVKRMYDDVQLLKSRGLDRSLLRSETAFQVDIDAIGLSELMERIKTTASEKQKEAKAMEIGKDDGGLRRKYQELYERRQMAAVMTESFHASEEQRKRAQVCRDLCAIIFIRINCVLCVM